MYLLNINLSVWVSFIRGAGHFKANVKFPDSRGKALNLISREKTYVEPGVYFGISRQNCKTAFSRGDLQKASCVTEKCIIRKFIYKFMIYKLFKLAFCLEPFSLSLPLPLAFLVNLIYIK